MLSNQKWRKRIDDLEVESTDKLLVGGINPVYTYNPQGDKCFHLDHDGKVKEMRPTQDWDWEKMGAVQV